MHVEELGPAPILTSSLFAPICETLSLFPWSDTRLFSGSQFNDTTGTNALRDTFVFGFTGGARGFSLFLEMSHEQDVHLDGTFALSSLGYVLITILGVDERRRGFPGAYAFMATEDSDKVFSFLKGVRDLAAVHGRPDWSPARVAMDCSHAFINAVGRALPDAKISLCVFHVKKSWREHFDTKHKVTASK